ncbi:MAG: sulfite exporter TauE/SafE family protein [Rhodobacteraceae bacterium]|nr:sulfite exporter TauE/SafE family protein [Paracoccaceae bacterium]
MPDLAAALLATPGLWWMMATIAVAGMVRGFTGFGTALIFVPVAGQFLPAADVILLITVTGVFSTGALLPRAWASADRAEVGTMAAVAVLTVPVGLWIMARSDPIVLRWIITVIACVTLVAVIAGWRWHGTPGLRGRAAIGGTAGVLGGLTGLTGPVVIIFNLASQRGAQAVRANTILFLGLMDVVLIVNLALGGMVHAVTVWLACLLALPYTVTVLIGQRLFDPAHERIYRGAAYAVVGLAVIAGLPILD